MSAGDRVGGGRIVDRLPRPLDPFRSFKVKTGLLVVAALFLASLMFWVTARWPFRYALALAMLVSLAVTQILAHGMTSPLREMTAAARAMATGDYSRRVRSTSRDEIGELARAFNSMAEDLEAADRYRRELIGNVSHELRTPISALSALLENVVDGVEEPDPARMQVALDQTERLGRLVAELLDLSRLEEGAVQLDRERFPVRDFLEDVVRQAVGPAGPRRVQVDVQPSGLCVDADVARLHQAVTNLVDNALRHGSARTQVVVRGRPAPEEGCVIIEVEDDGPGISPGERSRVFERFTRGGSTDGGTGLGLAIARWAVELHDGRIEVVDTVRGCCIRVTLPAG
ncbi:MULTISPECIES: HAMP domain-containing sensor histidine kinase [Rhodococcus]|uniref:histidine kinase n=1 Tax=Rhodococcus oxybenzonivorans TaxID=1990687 RepID=A0AAE5A6R6_9NOCA|nr:MULTISPECIES: HAMP domain-containing sensor histidine kinase [Rhodococcus]MDV7240696.1 HAMP domain-containing sensor histidine kinase [Rhodococcus oxybenzonivorans]MDV7265852.1 HAMP domain-containing sensor histidine kinase [Rhodococcus oxybenzonivorans]MDV7272969.1 HAMP domain-containing sensor histidine kinase [Rhodococcus oxybenzonivorans]MDV7333292.1 HAMP domain-containing sensor histidine kinase [Rhodococcus oxybenzonivorans]MDV7342459.1 HAMP domain-containing sensor histidine kinase [